MLSLQWSAGPLPSAQTDIARSGAWSGLRERICRVIAARLTRYGTQSTWPELQPQSRFSPSGRTSIHGPPATAPYSSEARSGDDGVARPGYEVCQSAVSGAICTSASQRRSPQTTGGYGPGRRPGGDPLQGGRSWAGTITVPRDFLVSGPSLCSVVQAGLQYRHSCSRASP
jgi:hypothetical protein